MTEQEIADEILRQAERYKMDEARRRVPMLQASQMQGLQPAGDQAADPQTPQAGPALDEFAYQGMPSPPVQGQPGMPAMSSPPPTPGALDMAKDYGRQAWDMAQDYAPRIGRKIRELDQTFNPVNYLLPRSMPPEQAKPQSATEATLQPYDPTTRDWLASKLMGNERASPERARVVEGLVGSRGLGNTGMSIADVVPGVGRALQAEEAVRSGDSMNMALAVIPPLPGAARAAAAPLTPKVLARDATGRPVTRQPLSTTEKSPDEIMAAIDERLKTTRGGGTPPMTGSPEINSTVPVTMGGKQPKEWTPGEWGTYGRAHDVPGLGPESDEAFQKSLKTYTDKNGREFTVPGGLEDTSKPFTYYDMLHMKAQGIDPNDLDPELHRRLHNRTTRSMQPGAGDDPYLTNYNATTMGMLSPNNPLLANEMAMQRTMAKSPADIDWMAKQTQWDPGTPGIGKEVRGPASRNIASELGLQAEERGGLGATGSVDYTRVSDFAKMYKEKPEFFKFDPTTQPGETAGEKWSNYVAKVSSQVPGLQMKTGSFGAVWQDPSGAAISAIDRHMAAKFHGDLFTNPKERAAFEKDAIKTFNKDRPKAERAATFEEMLDSKGGRGVYIEKVMGHLNAHSQPQFRLAGGEVNPRIPEHLQQADWVREPSNVVVPSAPYARALDANQQLALQNDQGLFANQWMEWDKIRQRYEPHEIKYPGLQKLPRMTLEQMRDVNNAHKALGYATAPANVRASFNPSSLGYFSVAPIGLLGVKGDPDDQP